MDEHIQIRPVRISELAQLQKISLATFLEAFSAVNEPRNMDDYVDKAFAINKLRAEVEESGSEFYFVHKHTELAGYLKINYGGTQTEPLGSEAMEIERIYLYSAYQGLGLGQAMMRFAIERGRAMQVKFIWLGVWENNDRAQRFYRQIGFKEFDKHVFVFGDERQIDLLMRYDLD